jgi:hypothetical protein
MALTLQSKGSLADWIKKQGPTFSCMKETHYTGQDTQRLKVKG